MRRGHVKSVPTLASKYVPRRHQNDDVFRRQDSGQYRDRFAGNFGTDLVARNSRNPCWTRMSIADVATHSIRVKGRFLSDAGDWLPVPAPELRPGQ